MRSIHPRLLSRLSLSTAILCMAATSYGQRGVQISSVNFIDGDAIFEQIELTNFGTTTEDMSNWRFCSHDENQVRVYSGGIGGSIMPGETQILQASDFSLAQPLLGSLAYSLAIFDRDAGGFGGTANIVDHLQWSIDGIHNTSAANRSDQAVAGGVWTSPTAWISTAADTGKIVLNDTTGGILHGPNDYDVIPSSPPPFACDLDADGDCDVADIDLLVSGGGVSADIDVWLAEASAVSSKTYVLGDINVDGSVNSIDLGLLLNNFGSTNSLLYSDGNTNGDAIVNSVDLGELLNNFAFSSQASSAAAVPEPAFGALMTPFLMIFAMFFSSWRRG